MFFWILISIIALVFVVSLIGSFATREPGAIGTAVIAFFVGVAVILGFSITTVDARAVGVQTAFGKYVGTVSSGLHFVAPWSSVEEFSTLTQSLHLDGEGGDDHGKKTPVAFKGGSNGAVETTVRWRTTEDGVAKQWRDYKTFENVRDNLVKADAHNSIRAEFSNFSPNEAIDGNNLNVIMGNVKEDLQKKLDAYGVTVDSIQITNVELGEQAQKAINRIVEANANTERAKSEQEKATIEAETARIRQQTQTPENLTRYCLEVLNNWDVKKNGNPPTMLNCGLGGSAPVIVGR